MSCNYSKSLGMAAALAAAAFSAGCNGDHGAAPPPPVNTTQNFSTFATQAFKQPATSTPVNFDNVTLVYDVNEDPTAFDALLMM